MVITAMEIQKDMQNDNLQHKETVNMKNKLSSNKIVNISFAAMIFCSFIFLPLAYAQENKEVTTNKIKLQAILTPPYVIGPGDQLTIVDRTLRELFGQVEQYNVVVSGDGYISIRLPDGTQENVLAAGQTLDDLSIQIRELFGRTLKNPLVYIQISRYRPINVYIGGEVVKPGVYKIESTSTTEKGGATSSTFNTFGLALTEAIQLAGGVKPRGNVTSITVTRGSNMEKKTVNLKTLLTGKEIGQDVNLQPGDVIYIPASEVSEEQAQNNVILLGKLAYQEVPVNVVGEVKTSGSFLLPNDATLLDALGKAGGLGTVGSLKKVRLSRYDETGVYRTYNINIHDLILKGIGFDQIALRPNDTIEFEPSKGKLTRHFIHDSSVNVPTTLFSTVAGSLGSFIVQDNFFNRTARLGKGSLFSGVGGGGSNPITIINGGNNRVIDK